MPPENPSSVFKPDCASAVEPYRVLIADDAPENQRLLAAYLKNFAFDLKLVSDGSQAVEEFASARYDIILMDIQMPHMDGLTATRRIRALERERGAKAVPIVCVTACTGCEDIQATVCAGCSEYCAKPVSQSHIIHVIAQYYNRSRREPLDLGLAAVASQARPDAAPIVQPQQDQNRGEPAEIFLTPPAQVRAIAPGYLATRRKEMAHLESLLANSDWAQLRTLGHRMKGSGAPYGFAEVTAIGGAIERAAQLSDAPALARELKKLADYLRRVRLTVA
jgi:CheY-like chemotaxis protein